MKHLTILIVAIFALFLNAISIAIAQTQLELHWPRFRGEAGAGLTEQSDWSGQLGDKDHLWKIELPGTGISSPVIAGAQLYVTSADEDQQERFLHCVSVKSGEVLWSKSFSFSKYKKHKNNSFASSSPAVDAERVYLVWQSQEGSSLIAFTHEGESVWEYDLGPYGHGQGAAASPIVHDGVVYVANDQKEPSFLVAIESQTGKELWKIPRLGQRACYATPGVWQGPQGQTEIVFSHCEEGVIGVEPKTGKVLWQISPFGDFSQRAICSPFTTPEGLIVTGSGAQGGERNIVILKRNSDSVEQPIQEVYRVTRGAPHVPTPVVKDGLFYLWGDLGIVTCVEMMTGKKVWQHRVGGNYFSSPICIGENLINIDTDGNVIVLATGATPVEKSRLALNDESRSTIAFAEDRLFVRTQHFLSAFQLK